MPDTTGVDGATALTADVAPADLAADVPHEDPADVPAPDDLDLEAPEADVAEQRTTVVEEDEAVWAPVPDGVDPADGTDQRRVVRPDEDEYR
ncbi:hypothetical protein [Yinghuangia seranimata]|uniref:hypothetical protein n=1 Tax=Yinghuangia seranimata TaxID=408067 RepID=UPI00248B5A90|nr:hypothetical protein [Yinghuangia seranimata]MDI2131016.1 hypothetical protein [Yinghuangia seranimata]